MKDDYLWDPKATPDPDIERFEQMLGQLRGNATVPPRLTETVRVKADTTDTAPPTNAGSVRLQPDLAFYAGVRFLAPALAAAAAIVLMVGLTWKGAVPAAGWNVAVIVGTPRVGASVLVGEGRIAVGQTLTTDAGSRARMEVSDIGQVTIDESTRVRLAETRDGHHRLALERGTLHAAITAPPGQFVVSTPSATATDLGCVYSLHIDEDGSGILSVQAGWVAFEERGRESFVPMGASSRTDRVNGPGTPRYDDTDQAFRDAIDVVDGSRDVESKATALRFVLEHARGRDAMTLWHLIPRVSGENRIAVVDALATRAPMPLSVSRAAVLRLDRASLDQWWDTLGLDEASWWRKWKGAYPAATNQGVAAAPQSCAETPTVRATPPPTDNAGTLGDGPWWVNADRTLWMQSATGAWHAGYNQKNMMVKPADMTPAISGARLDAPAPPMEVRWVPQHRAEFQTMGLGFPTEGCWRITASAGDHELSFVTNVRR